MKQQEDNFIIDRYERVDTEQIFEERQELINKEILEQGYEPQDFFFYL